MEQQTCVTHLLKCLKRKEIKQDAKRHDNASQRKISKEECESQLRLLLNIILPFSFVEYEGIRNFNYLNPDVKHTAKADVQKLYKKENDDIKIS